MSIAKVDSTAPIRHYDLPHIVIAHPISLTGRSATPAAENWNLSVKPFSARYLANRHVHTYIHNYTGA